MKTLALGFLAMVIAAAGALAQSPPPGQLAPGQPDGVLRGPYITGSGATVDKPGSPQGSAPTQLDRTIRREDNQIDKGICKGC